MNRPYPRDVIQAVCSSWQMTKADLVEYGNQRGRDLDARNAAAFLLVRTFGFSGPRAALALERDATTIFFAAKTAAAKMLIDPDYAARIRGIKQVIKQSLEGPVPMSLAPEAVGPPAEKVAEIRKLRARGWSTLGLSKRTGIPPAEVAKIVGVQWGGERA